VQFNRAIINARDEPLADYRKYRRLHLLIGDSNMSPYATALKIGTTACVLSLLEDGRLPRNLVLADAVQSTRDISRDLTQQWIVHLENGKTIGALDVQWEFHHLAQKYLRNSSAETNWLLENWGFVLEAIANNHQALIGGVDWITKKWLLEAFVESEGLSWDDPWLQSVDLEYHNIDPLRGLFFAVTPGKRIAEWNSNVRRSSATHVPPANTRASGRARAVAFFQDCNAPYVINWDSIACDNRDFLVMGDPFQTYNEEVERFLAKPRTAEIAIDPPGN
jgi:proteasome accessory factor A